MNKNTDFLKNTSNTKIPDDLIAVFNRLDSPNVINAVSTMYTMYLKQVFFSEQALSADSYGISFRIPPNQTKDLQRIIGLDDKRLVRIFAELHAQKAGSIYNVDSYMTNEMYTDTIYLTHLTFIMFALYKNGSLKVKSNNKLDKVASSAISLISARLWNGRIVKFYPTGYDPEIGKYVQYVKLSNRFKLKKFKSPAALILYDYMPNSVDHFNNMDLINHPHEIVYTFSRVWNKIHGLFKRVTGLYMETYRSGHRLSSTDSYRTITNDSGTATAITEQFTTLRHDIASKSSDIMLQLAFIEPEKFPVGFISKFRATPYMFSSVELVRIFEGFKNEKFDTRVEELVKSVLTHVINKHKITNINRLCSELHTIDNDAELIIKSKRDQSSIGIKNNIDGLLSEILGKNIHSIGNKMKISNYRKTIMYLIVMYISASCNKVVKYAEVDKDGKFHV